MKKIEKYATTVASTKTSITQINDKYLKKLEECEGVNLIFNLLYLVNFFK